MRLLAPTRRERLLVLGAAPLAQDIIREIEDRRGARGTVVALVADSPAAATIAGSCPVLGPTERLAEIVSEVKPDRVIVALDERRRQMPIGTLVECCAARGIAVETAAEFYERLARRLAIESVLPTSVVFGPRFGPSRAQRAAARLLSIVVSLIGLVAFAPVLALIALAVKIDSRGPVFFVHERVGAQGRPFRLLKFRTMHPAAVRRSEWERDNRDRVTRVGRWLRALRLDELPQFINVLRGEMNIVGPRPHPVSNFELLTLVARNLNDATGCAIGYYALRTTVRPGITGWAQVRYRYANDVEEEIEKLRYDLYYVKHACLALDVRILAATIRVALLGAARIDREQPVRFAAPVSAPALAIPARFNEGQAA